MPAVIESGKTIQTTVRLPEALYRELRELLEQGRLEGESLNDVMINALQQSARSAAEKRIDEQFAGMATDESYTTQCRVLAEEFARADWEALPEDIKHRGTR